MAAIATGAAIPGDLRDAFLQRQRHFRAHLYFGGGLRYDPFRRTKAIMLATASPREGIHLVLYEDGGIRRMPAEEFARLRAGAGR